jgi:hypothetical protein
MTRSPVESVRRLSGVSGHRIEKHRKILDRERRRCERGRSEVWIPAPIRPQFDDLVIVRVAGERGERRHGGENNEASVSGLREAVKITCRSPSYAISISRDFSDRESERGHARVFRSIRIDSNWLQISVRVHRGLGIAYENVGLSVWGCGNRWE